MSGDVLELGDAATSICEEGPRKRVVHGVSVFPLSNQYIMMKEGRDIYKFIQGTRMGPPQSGSLADVALFVSAEDGHINNVKKLKEANIVLWLRFRDDILVVARPSRSMREFYIGFKNRPSSLYDVECVEVGPMVTVLQTVLHIKKGKIQVRPKPQPLGPPLSSLSCHPWPLHLQVPQIK